MNVFRFLSGKDDLSLRFLLPVIFLIEIRLKRSPCLGNLPERLVRFGKQFLVLSPCHNIERIVTKTADDLVIRLERETSHGNRVNLAAIERTKTRLLCVIDALLVGKSLFGGIVPEFLILKAVPKHTYAHAVISGIVIVVVSIVLLTHVQNTRLRPDSIVRKKILLLPLFCSLRLADHIDLAGLKFF